MSLEQYLFLDRENIAELICLFKCKLLLKNAQYSTDNSDESIIISLSNMPFNYDKLIY